MRGARDAGGRAVFSREAARRAEGIELRTRGLVESVFSGEYHSLFKGRGLEFSDVREYVPGDDVRSIDWNVTARRGRLHVKQNVEERQLTALLAVDLSASKEFGTGPRSNLEIAAEIAAILAFSATANNDRVALLLVTDRVERFIPPNTGRRHALRLVLELLAFEPEGTGTRLGVGLEYASRVLRQRASVFLISDFLTDAEDDPGLEHAARRVARDHDLVPVRLSDPAQGLMPSLGLVALLDPESGARVVVDTATGPRRASLLRDAEETRHRVDALFRELALDVMEIDTRLDPVPRMMGFFRRRERLGR